MTQGALKNQGTAAEEAQVSEALASIRSVIKNNLEQGFENFNDTKGGEASLENVISLEELAMKADLSKTGQQKEAQQGPSQKADVLLLTKEMEDLGPTKTVQKKETGMSDEEQKAVEEAMAEVTGKVAEESTETAAEEAETTTDTAVPEEAAETETAPEATTEAITDEAMPEAPAPEPEATEAPVADFEMGANEPESVNEIASDTTLAESAAAFSELATVARQLSGAPQDEGAAPVTSDNAGGHTVDALMRELLRPLLKDWLDTHLPSLVKWLVTEQIEKMLKDQMGGVTGVSAPAAEANTAPEPAMEEPAMEETAPAPEDEGEQTEGVDPMTAMDFDAPGEAPAA